MSKESIEKCYLIYDEDGYLACNYNHSIGEECVLDECQCPCHFISTLSCSCRPDCIQKENRN